MFLVCDVCDRVLFVLWCVVWCSWSLLWCCGVCVFLCVWRVSPRCVCGVLGVLWSWLGPRQSFLWALGAVVPRHFWLGSDAGSDDSSSSILAEGFLCSSLPLVAGVCCCCWRLVPRPSWLRALGVVPRHSWLGSAGGGGGGWSLAIPD